MLSVFNYRNNLHVKDAIPAVLKWGRKDGPKPDVSILMPVYNHPHFFKLALDTAINQDYMGFYEIIVLDNNLEDDVDAVNEFEKYIIEKNCPNILYFKNKHNIEGINSFNRLPQLARADYFTYLHDDDEFTQNCISELLRIKEKWCLTKELIVPNFYTIDRDSIVIKRTQHFGNRSLWGRDYRMTIYDWFMMNYTNGCGALHSKEAFMELGGYCADYIPTADYAFYCSYVNKYGGFFANEQLFKYRIAENDSIGVYEECAKMCEIIRNDISTRINLPSIFLKRLISAKKNREIEISEKLFKRDNIRDSSLMDKVIISIAIIVKLLSHIKG